MFFVFNIKITEKIILYLKNPVIIIIFTTSLNPNPFISGSNF